MSGLALTAGLFALAWLLVEAAGLGAGVGLLLVAVLVFAVGECLYDTIVAPLVAGLAPDELRGRYLAVSAFSWQLGFIAGPGLGGLLLATSTQALWPVAAGICLAAAAGVLALERKLPPAVRATPRM
jgi:MFS family permease